MWQRTLEEFELENQGCPVENCLRPVARFPFVFWSKRSSLSLSVDWPRSNSTIPPITVLHWIFTSCSNPARVQSWWSVKVKCLLMSKRLSCSCDGFCGASKQDSSITLKFIALRVEVHGDGFFFCSQPLILLWWIVPTIAELDKCHFNQPGKTRRRSVKGILALFCYILTFGLFKFMGVSKTHLILSMLLTHTTSGPPVT